MNKKIKVNKSRDSLKKLRKQKLSPRLRKILPVVFLFKEIMNISPSEVLQLIPLMTSSKSVELLNNSQKKELLDYLEKWGFDYE